MGQEVRHPQVPQRQALRVLVTGASGFVGSALCTRLEDDGVLLRRTVRTPTGAAGEVVLDDTSPDSAWREALFGVDVVVHLAARVHVVRERDANADLEFQRVNEDLTRRIAIASAACGVRRFVFLSSAKVAGETSTEPYRESSSVHPQDGYARSKWRAEQMLTQVASASGLQVVMLRPPLVYGPNLRGNFLRLMSVIRRRYPLPFGKVNNLRSLVYLNNLVDAIVLTMRHPNATGPYYVRDDEDLSTPDLIRRLAPLLGVQARLMPVPVPLIRMGARVLRRQTEADRILGSLQVDDTRLRTLLGWGPPFSSEQGFRATAAWFLDTHCRGRPSSR